MFILRLSGCNEEDCPACSGGNVQFACTVKSLYFCIVSQKQFLHKRVFVIFFGKTFQDALNLADSQFTNRWDRSIASPYDEKIGNIALFGNFVQAAGCIGQTECGALAEVIKFCCGWKSFFAGRNENGIVLQKQAEVEMADAFPVIHIFLKCTLYGHEIKSSFLKKRPGVNCPGSDILIES